jgi:hypothetical protein
VEHRSLAVCNVLWLGDADWVISHESLFSRAAVIFLVTLLALELLVNSPLFSCLQEQVHP